MGDHHLPTVVANIKISRSHTAIHTCSFMDKSEHLAARTDCTVAWQQWVGASTGHHHLMGPACTSSLWALALSVVPTHFLLLFVWSPLWENWFMQSPVWPCPVFRMTELAPLCFVLYPSPSGLYIHFLPQTLVQTFLPLCDIRCPSLY